MRITAVLFVFTALSLGIALAQPLDGRAITLQAGSQTSLNVPVTLPYEGSAPEGQVTVVEPATGKSYPATVRNGELVFVPEGAMPNTSHEYQVKVVTGGAPTPKVVIKKNSGSSELEVFIEDVPFTVYHYSNDNKKPFLWPVYGEGGVTVTRNWPMGPREGSQDHVHQKSIWSAYGKINGVDCWMEGEGSGIQHSNEVTWGDGDAYGWVHAKNTWQDKDGKPIVDEEREYRFYASTPDARIFDAALTFTATYGEVKFEDTKEAGIMALRIRPEIEEQKGGTITNGSGGKGEKECWGLPSPWCDYSGTIKDAGVRGIAVFDHPTNFRHPARWHVRSYGLMGANYFGAKALTQGKEPAGDYTMKQGETMTFRYRVYVHSGSVDDARVADRYADFATPPQVAWK